MNTKIITLIAFLLAMTVCGSASAALFTDSAALSGQSPQTYGGVGSLSVRQFDPSLGTLNAVAITVSNYFTWTSMAENMDGPNKVFTHTLNQRVAITDGSATILDDTDTFNGSWTLGSWDGSFDFSGPSGITANGSSVLETAKIAAGGTDLSRYIGTGSLSYAVYSNSNASLTLEGGNGGTGSGQNFFAAATVTYDYTPVPVPAAAWLLGSGLLGLIGIRRKVKG